MAARVAHISWNSTAWIVRVLNLDVCFVRPFVFFRDYSSLECRFGFRNGVTRSTWEGNLWTRVMDRRNPLALAIGYKQDEARAGALVSRHLSRPLPIILIQHPRSGVAMGISYEDVVSILGCASQLLCDEQQSSFLQTYICFSM